MNTITLDFSGIKSYWELHEYLKEIFRLPDIMSRRGKRSVLAEILGRLEDMPL